MHGALRTLLSAGLALATITAQNHAQTQAPAKPPNVVILYADDLGYGDVSCYGAKAVQTPNIDRLAAAGLRFTDAHCTSATCTPSRYSLLTGEYAFRQKGTGVLPGNAKLILTPGRTTLPAVMQRAGYRTAVIGKWHLGLGNGDLDWNGSIAPGPLEVGFDECMLLPATGDRVPCVYVDDHAVRGLEAGDPILVSYGKRIGDAPTGRERPDLLKMKWFQGHDMTIVNGISRIGYMTGGVKARWVDEDMADAFVTRGKQFLQANKDRPFCLYFATHDIHVPRVPHPRFQGKTTMGPRGDAIVQLDWCVGELLNTLDELKLTNNTLVILSSDNGPVVNDGYVDDSEEKLGSHRPAGPWRGGKYSALEAGTRVPFVVRWPGHVAAGESAALVSQVDLLHSLAHLVGQPIAEGDAPDSQNQLDALLGKDKVGRDHLIEHSGSLSLRIGSWKYIEPSQRAAYDASTKTELGNAPVAQLYDLSKDPGETTNLAATEPERTAGMAARLQELRAAGRSR
ncbi:MAG: arylsulfatase [Planctomycetes bacterium]|nr:arylsulfatase [Planctomycetota bacterium]